MLLQCLSPSTARSPGEVRAFTGKNGGPRGGERGTEPQAEADEGIENREDTHAENVKERAAAGTGATLKEAAEVVKKLASGDGGTTEVGGVTLRTTMGSRIARAAATPTGGRVGRKRLQKEEPIEETERSKHPEEVTSFT